MIQQRNDGGFALISACVFMMLTGAFAMLIFTLAQDAVRAERLWAMQNTASLAANSALEQERTELYAKFLTYYSTPPNKWSGVKYSWFEEVSETAVGIGSVYTIPKEKPVAVANSAFAASVDGIYYNVSVEKGVTLSDSLKAKYDVDDVEKLLLLRIEAYHAEDPSDPEGSRISGTTKVVEEVVSFGDGPAEIFDNAYFINNFGWMYGSSLTVNGNMRSNGNLNFKYNPTVNGNSAAGNSNSGWNKDISSEGAIIGTPRHDSETSYNGAGSGTSGNSKARYLVTQETLNSTAP